MQCKLESILVEHFPLLNSIFRHYCGFGVLEGQPVDTISFTEFVKLLTHTTLFTTSHSFSNLISVHRDMTIHRQQQAGNRNPDGMAVGGSHEEEDDQAEIEFQRHEFIEALIRLARGRAEFMLSASESFAKMMVELKKPSIIELLEEPVLEGLARPSVQAMLQQALSYLFTIFNYYRVRGTGGDEEPTMDVHEFLECLRDAGLLEGSHRIANRSMLRADGTVDTSGGEKKNFSHQHAIVAFTASQTEAYGAKLGGKSKKCDSDNLDNVDATLASVDSDKDMIFAEFVEAVCRIAQMKYRDAPGDYFDRLHSTLLAMKSLASAIMTDAKDRAVVGRRTKLHHRNVLSKVDSHRQLQKVG